MTFPLMALAIGAVVAGLVGIPAALGGSDALEHFLQPSFTGGACRPDRGGARSERRRRRRRSGGRQSVERRGGGAGARSGAAEESGAHVSRGAEIGLMAFSVAVALIGIGLAWKFYVTSPEISDQLAERWAGLHTLLLNNAYYVDEAIRN